MELALEARAAVSYNHYILCDVYLLPIEVHKWLKSRIFVDLYVQGYYGEHQFSDW